MLAVRGRGAEAVAAAASEAASPPARRPLPAVQRHVSDELGLRSSLGGAAQGGGDGGGGG